VVAGGALVGISRTHQYYRPRQPAKDWQTKQLIEMALRDHPSYGHKRLAIHLKINKKRVLRVMKLFGIKPYRRTTPKVYKKPKDSVFPNLLLTETPGRPGDIYASDFTYIKHRGKWLYVATIIDIYTREIVGVSMLNTHATQLVINALSGAILHRAPPRIIHSDQGSEYSSINYTNLVQSLQNRFDTLGEWWLVSTRRLATITRSVFTPLCGCHQCCLQRNTRLVYYCKT